MALALLRLPCSRPDEPLEADWVPAENGWLLENGASRRPFVLALSFREPPETLGEEQVRQVREALERFRRSPVEASCLLLVHGSDARQESFRLGVEAAVNGLRESGRVEYAEAWDRQKLLREAFNAMTDRVLAAIRARPLALSPVAAVLDDRKGAPLSDVPLRVSLLSTDPYRLRSQDGLGPTNIADPAREIFEGKRRKISLLLGGFGFGKTTVAARALAADSRKVLYVPGAALSEQLVGAKDLLSQCIDMEELFTGCPAEDRSLYERIARASIEYLFKDPDLQAAIVFDGLDESPFLNRKGGLQSLFNGLRQVSIPVVLTMRTEFWETKRRELETIFGEVARDESSIRVQRIRAVELLDWGDEEIRELILRARRSCDEPEEVRRLEDLASRVEDGRFKAIYGDIPRRPLFLRLIVESVARLGLPGERIGRATLFRQYAEEKILRDIRLASAAGGGRPALLAEDESTESVLETSWEAMHWAAASMAAPQEGRLELLPTCSIERLLKATPRLGRIRETLALHLQSLLMPSGRRAGQLPTEVAFAHRAFQEFFLAWHLLREGGLENGWEIPDSVMEWVDDLQAEGLVEPRSREKGPGLPAVDFLPATARPVLTPSETPDLELLVSKRPEADRWVFDFQLNGRDPAWRFNWKTFGPLSFDGNPTEIFRQHLAEVPRARDAAASLRNTGAYLSEKLLPADLRKALTSLKGTARTLLVQSDDAWIPWEMLRLGSNPESRSADGNFLCEAFAMTRWLRGYPFTTSLPLRQIFTIAPRDADLPSSEEECAAVAGFEKAGRRKVERLLARRGTVHEALRRGEADGWHFVGHGFHKEDVPDLSCIQLEEGEVLTPADLSGEHRKMGEKHPLVFLNACSSGRAGLSLTGVGGWARHFLEAEAGAFLGALWPIKDRRGNRFAEAFYDAFTGGAPISEAVHAARQAVRSDDDPTWLAYTVFAHPLAVCGEPGTWRIPSTAAKVPTNAPPRPSLFVGRIEDLQAIKERLGAGGDASKPPSPLQVLTAVRGWPGVGKSTLAAALSHEPEIRSAFPGGILWAALGESPDLLSEIAGWGPLLESESLEGVANLREAVACLRALLRDRRVLLVLDDVWEPEQVQPVQSACGEGCAVLVTTRQLGVAQSLQADPDSVYTLEVLDEADALDLLAALAPEVVEQYPEECRRLVRDLECLPLSLQVAGRQLHSDSQMGWDLRDLLRELGGGALLRGTAPPDRMDLERRVIPTVDALLRRSTDRLEPQTRERFRRLGGFAAKPATFRLDALRRVWAVEDPRPTVRILVERGLLEPVGDSRFQMHSLLVRHAASLDPG